MVSNVRTTGDIVVKTGENGVFQIGDRFQGHYDTVTHELSGLLRYLPRIAGDYQTLDVLERAGVTPGKIAARFDIRLNANPVVEIRAAMGTDDAICSQIKKRYARAAAGIMRDGLRADGFVRRDHTWINHTVCENVKKCPTMHDACVMTGGTIRTLIRERYITRHLAPKIRRIVR